MFLSIDYLKEGNPRQQLAYKAMHALGLLIDLEEYTPVLCGTLPINIDIDNSDLDIIMEVKNFDAFEKSIVALYGCHEGFRIKKTHIRGNPVMKANFLYGGFEFELFGQDVLVTEQYAYLHMIIENTLLRKNPPIREEIIALKKQGYKTEPAFCKVLGLEGDPYEGLIMYGKERGIIT
ncbi:hypothetical protein J2S74_004979 [Evansella vedderi]|uniref:DUF4269 domain-containing protein n=1 Tax=Evansella vedderi TaxID=38282 RepID=A0ABU0A206_9BACI|nr:DUF4269 domain-containing protein [Evansella vedderi]MDQ0257521.1 hypothetical protein [Evansella vedderi]